MPRSSYADIHLDVEAGGPQTQRDRPHETPDRDTPFRILVIGDFGGTADTPVTVDRDNIDDVLETMDVRLSLPVEQGEPIQLRFLKMDDFHPDNLVDRVPLFARLRQPVPAPAPVARPSAPMLDLSGSLLDAALEATEARSEGREAPPSADPLAKYVRGIVAPHLVPKPDATRVEREKQAAEACSRLMRDILHHPKFQALESAWRSLDLLVRELETGPLLKVTIANLPKSALNADVGGADDLTQTRFHKLLKPQSSPWALAVANYTFDSGMDDLNLLGRIGLIARQAGTPVVAAASPAIPGGDGPADREGWNLIRSLPESRYLGLVLPRFLLRMPYGKEGERCERMPFEEMDPVPNPSDYLWGNGAFVCACLLGQTFSEFGWHMEPGEFLTLGSRPMHVYHENGEAKITPPAELFVSERTLDAFHEAGLMGLIASVNSDQLRLSGFRSLAAPESALAGRWR